MCDFEGRLIAWLDHELSNGEAADVERHVETCSECRSRVQTYKDLSRTFETYCDAVVAAKAQRRVPRWMPVLSCAAAVVAVLFLALPRPRVEPPPVHTSTATVLPVTAPVPSPAFKKTVHKRHAAPPVREQAMNWTPAEPAIRIAIPAEAMFPPGAIPEGMNFIAELSIAPDGSVERLSLRP